MKNIFCPKYNEKTNKTRKKTQKNNKKIIIYKKKKKGKTFF
jgi:hypothetical protein